MFNPHDLLTLMSVPGVGPQRIRALVGRFGSAKTVLEADRHSLRQVENIDEKTANAILNERDAAFADRQLQSADKNGVQLVAYWDDDYPEALKAIHDPPVLLFVKGNRFSENHPTIAVVGTRTPSTYGRTMAEKFAVDLVQAGAAVASGMARGVDTGAHRGAIKAGGPTWAVLGCCVDVVYPPENKKLYQDIVESGAVVSEFPMNTPPDPGHFPRRNRIISGLSLGTLVIEAGEKSGALITAYMALEQNREVFALPGNVTSPKSRGTNRLIQEGAKLVTCLEDIASELPALAGKSGKPEVKVLESLTLREKTLWETLSDEPRHVDEIANGIGITTSEALAILLSLELKSCARQLPGTRFVRL
jgi:DNA processing protein